MCEGGGEAKGGTTQLLISHHWRMDRNKDEDKIVDMLEIFKTFVGATSSVRTMFTLLREWIAVISRYVALKIWSTNIRQEVLATNLKY